MRRRTAILAGAGAIAALGGTQVLGSRTRSVVTEEVRTIDAPGSTAGQMQIPSVGTPMIVDLFATWCAPCVTQMGALSMAHANHGERVRFVSVTNERLGGGFDGDDIAAWWRSHGGAWTVAVDEGSNVMRAVQATGLPYLVGFDADGQLQVTHGGLASVAEIESMVRAVG